MTFMNYVLRPARRVPIDGILRTRSGRQVRVTSHNAFAIMGMVRYKGKRQEIHWFDTGNHIGSNFPHSLDIDWKETYRLQKRRLKAEAIRMSKQGYVYSRRHKRYIRASQ